MERGDRHDWFAYPHFFALSPFALHALHTLHTARDGGGESNLHGSLYYSGLARCFCQQMTGGPRIPESHGSHHREQQYSRRCSAPAGDMFAVDSQLWGFTYNSQHTA